MSSEIVYTCSLFVNFKTFSTEYFHLAAEVASDRVWRILAPAGVEARLSHVLGRARGVLHEGPLDPLERLQPRTLVQHHAVIRLPDLHLNVTTCNVFQLIINQYL